MLEFIGAIVMIVVVFKLTWLAIKLCGRLLGAIISAVGYVVIGGVIVLISIPLIVLPILAIVGIIAIITGIMRA